MLDGYITVVAPIPGTPSDRAGLIGGDQIVKINGNSAYKLTTEEVVSKLRGEKGTSVVVTIKRYGTENFDVTLIRDIIPINSVLATFLYNEEVGYIKINRFANKTYSELTESIKILESQGMNKLVLDLRNNGGGGLDEAINMAGLFIGQNPVVIVRQSGGRRITVHRSREKAIYRGPLLVMLNRYSASASEILAGALHDFNRAILVGDNTTFGKGTVQNIFQLPEGYGALKVTIAQFYRVSGWSTQNRGVESNLTLPSINLSLIHISEPTRRYASG